jgi:hypothetical protein
VGNVEGRGREECVQLAEFELHVLHNCVHHVYAKGDGERIVGVAVTKRTEMGYEVDACAHRACGLWTSRPASEMEGERGEEGNIDDLSDGIVIESGRLRAAKVRQVSPRLGRSWFRCLSISSSA